MALFRPRDTTTRGVECKVNGIRRFFMAVLFDYPSGVIKCQWSPIAHSNPMLREWNEWAKSFVMQS